MLIKKTKINIINRKLVKKERVDNMSELEIENLREKILNSQYEYKKKMITSDLTELKNKVKAMSSDEIKKLIDKKVLKIKNENIEEKELEKLECEIAFLISSFPINAKKSEEYWKGKEKYARNKK